MTEESVEELINQLETLRLQESRVIERLRAARAREADPTTTFIVGNRVEVTNRITIPFGRAANINDRRAIITKVKPNQIYFRTLNGSSTWRARKNLRIVPDNEVW